ncbi:MAG: 3-deoxy-manno-octulosonate cytidylyltransferase [Flavobacteriales bacterium]|nr:3-deoxy-manno-octulosonate cytidylyltransferase [Flavobacteriales bacterium]
MKTAAIIPARFASTRFPGKPLAQIGGKSMIQRVYERAMESGLDFVAVATDNTEIFNHVQTFGGNVIMTSDKCLNGTERIAEAIAGMEDLPDLILNIQGDEPFIKPEQIQLVINCLKDPGTGIATLKKKIQTEDELYNPNCVKVVTDLDDYALYFSRNTIPYLKAGSSLPDSTSFYKHIGIYGFQSKVLLELVRLPVSALQKAENLEQLGWLENGYLIKVAETNHQSLAIDTPEDLENANEWLKTNLI